MLKNVYFELATTRLLSLVEPYRSECSGQKDERNPGDDSHIGAVSSSQSCDQRVQLGITPYKLGEVHIRLAVFLCYETVDLRDLLSAKLPSTATSHTV